MRAAGRPVMIMLPAMPCGTGFYDAQVAALSDLVEIRVMVLDEPVLAASAARLLAAAPPRFLLAGNAYGGGLACEVAAAAPERIAGLWLMNCNPDPHPDPAGALALCDRVRAEGLEPLLAEWAGVIVAPGAAAARDRFLALARAEGAERFVRQYAASAGRAGHRAALARLTAPTLLLWGADDDFVPAVTGRSLAASMPAARHVELAGCRHLPPLEQPDRTNRVARAFLQSALARRPE